MTGNTVQIDRRTAADEEEWELNEELQDVDPPDDGRGEDDALAHQVADTPPPKCEDPTHPGTDREVAAQYSSKVSAWWLVVSILHQNPGGKANMASPWGPCQKQDRTEGQGQT